MADTMRGSMPDKVCSDCGVKGCLFAHWGPLVPPDKGVIFAGLVFTTGKRILRSMAGRTLGQ